MEVAPHRAVLVLELAIPDDEPLTEAAARAIEVLRPALKDDPRYVGFHVGIREVADGVMRQFL